MRFKLVLLFVCFLISLTLAAQEPQLGADSIGDSYYPQIGNG